VDALDSLARTRGRTAFLFDGHGSEDGFYLTKGQPTDTGYIAGVKISAEEMADALSVRWFLQKRAAPKSTVLDATLVFDSCSSQNYLRSVAAKLAQRGIPLPRLMIAVSEFGQYGFTQTENPLGSESWSWLRRNETVGNMIRNKRDVLLQSPSIFIPRPENPTRLMQLGGVVLPQEENTATA
jgi:hypothetical protein